MEGTQRQTGQSTQTAYCEYLLRTGKVPDYGQQPSVLAYTRCSCAAKSTANTFKTSKKHPFRTADSVSSSAICLHTWEPLKTNTELREYLLEQSVSVAMIPHSVHLNKSRWAGDMIAFFTPVLLFIAHLRRDLYPPCTLSRARCEDWWFETLWVTFTGPKQLMWFKSLK